MEISYRKIGDYYIPNLTIDEETRTYNLGKYSRLRLKYLKEISLNLLFKNYFSKTLDKYVEIV